MPEPLIKRAVAFFDGQNLYHTIKMVFGHKFPNYDPLALARVICVDHGWELEQVCFYTGVPDQRDDPFWHHFWSAKLLAMSRRGVRVFSRPLKYRNKEVILPGGGSCVVPVAEEKGIDVRLALDIVTKAYLNELDVALVFSQDQDLSEVADEIRAIAKRTDRWIKIASVVPDSPTARNLRGINHTDWIRLSRSVYDSCLDLNDYRRPKV